MSLFFKRVGDNVIFFGPGTFQKKERLKSLGARFNGTDKVWFIPNNLLEGVSFVEELSAIELETDGSRKQSTQMSVARAAPQDSTTSENRDLLQKRAKDLGGFTIRELLNQVHDAITSTFPNPVWVVGEVQNFARKGEASFFELAESKKGAHATATTTVKATLWGSQAAFLSRRHSEALCQEIFRDGSYVRLLVRVTLFKDRAQISLVVEDFDPELAMGAMALARAALVKKLRTSGLDQKNKQLPMPTFPLKIVLISARGSRAESDFLDQLKLGGFPGHVVVIACAMQGERVPLEVVSAFRLAHEQHPDIIVMSRGGGSAADLRWFDGEEVALAIAHARVPVLAAIGHHDDQSVAEEVCHTRAKTPTAAAEVLLDLFRVADSQLSDYAERMSDLLMRESNILTRSLTMLEARMHSGVLDYCAFQDRRLMQALGSLSQSVRLSLTTAGQDLERLATRMFEDARRQCEVRSMTIADLLRKIDHQWARIAGVFERMLADLGQKLIGLDPSPWLKKGWTQLYDRGKGFQIMSSRDVVPQQVLFARIFDGTIELSVTAVTPKEID